MFATILTVHFLYKHFIILQFSELRVLSESPDIFFCKHKQLLEAMLQHSSSSDC